MLRKPLERRTQVQELVALRVEKNMVSRFDILSSQLNDLHEFQGHLDELTTQIAQKKARRHI